MKTIAWPCLLALPLAALTLAGCGGPSPEQPKAGDGATPPATTTGQAGEAAVRANLAKLSPEDRKLAEEQQFCAVETKNPLGSMGEPGKVPLGDTMIFTCCEGCNDSVRAEPEAALKKLKELKKSPTPKK